MNIKGITHYRHYLQRYVDNTKQRRPNFSISSWAKAMGLKSTSTLTKILNGEREAGPELVEKLIRYFKFNSLEETQFKNLVALSKLKESTDRTNAIAEMLLQSQALKELNVRLLEFDQFQLLSSYIPLAIREMTRLSKMKISSLASLFPQINEKEVQETIHLLKKMNLVERNSEAYFVATDDHLSTEHEIPSEAIQSYHDSSLDLAKERLKEVDPAEREFQSLVMLMHSQKLPHLKEKIRLFLDTLELDTHSPTVDQLYQVQIQVFPVSKRFEEQQNPNLKEKNQ